MGLTGASVSDLVGDHLQTSLHITNDFYLEIVLYINILYIILKIISYAIISFNESIT